MGRAHEFETILGAIACLVHQNDITFLFVGAGNQRPHLEREAVRRGFSHVQFKPYQPQGALAASLGVADVHLVSLLPRVERFIVPSKFYGIAAAGRPIIFLGDPDGEIGKTVRTANCGAAVRPGEASELATLLLRLKNDEGLRLEWGRNARRLIDEKFSREKAMSRWREVLSG